MTDTPLFDTVLIANRGEIACRIIRTLRRLGIRSVAVYSDADAGARHVALADVARRIGPAPAAQSYLDIDAVIAAARETGAQAIHPGYGFLAENAEFAQACADAGIVFIGPSADAIRTMGDKITAKNTVQERDVPTVPGIARAGLTDAELIDAADGVGYPLLIKPSAGGGGKGMHVVTEPSQLEASIAAARREAKASFGDDSLFLERYLTTPRHIEVQVLADRHGAVVHLGERECSLQRRHQKVIEEAPSPLLDEATRSAIGLAACETARSVAYEGAGTVEFIVSADAPDEFFFMEMNTRLQVEHPVTEEITGIDLVEQQLRIAVGLPLAFTQDDVVLSGHSIEARVYAEDPASGFLPTGGHVSLVAHPEGVRVDTAIDSGLDVSIDYDPMLAKIIAHGTTREEARRRLVRALDETAVFGFPTNVEFNRLLLELPEVIAGDLDTGLIGRTLDALAFAEADDRVFAEAALLLDATAPRGSGPWSRRDGWRLGDPAPRRYPLQAGAQSRTVLVTGSGADLRVQVVDAAGTSGSPSAEENARSGGASAPDSSSRTRELLPNRSGVAGQGTDAAGTSGSPSAEENAHSGGASDPDSSSRTRELLPNGSASAGPGTSDGGAPASVRSLGENRYAVAIGGESRTFTALTGADAVSIARGGTVFEVSIARAVHASGADAATEPHLDSPMPGTVVQVLVEDGAHVEEGAAVIVVEAMKMEHVLRAGVSGTVSLRAAQGDTVARGQTLAAITPASPAASVPASEASQEERS